MRRSIRIARSGSGLWLILNSTRPSLSTGRYGGSSFDWQRDDMALFRVVKPAAAIISVTEMKQHLRVEEATTDHDDLIAALIDAVTQRLDGPDGLLQRALQQQTWDLKFDCFPWRHCLIRIPLPPLIAIESVKYIDKDGVEGTVSTDDYRVIGVAGSPP